MQKCLNLRISSQRGWLYVVNASCRSIQGNLLLGFEILWVLQNKDHYLLYMSMLTKDMQVTNTV